MTPERWRQIENLCHATMALQSEDRAAFLTQACAGDDDLRREVESLIAQEPRAAGFMSVPAVALSGPDGARRLLASRGGLIVHEDGEVEVIGPLPAQPRFSITVPSTAVEGSLAA